MTGRTAIPLLLLPILAACGEQVLAPTLPATQAEALLPAADAVPTGTKNTVQLAPFGLNIEWIPCAMQGVGEWVTIEGQVRVVNGFHFDAAGGAHGHVSIVGLQATGVGLTSGSIYRQNGPVEMDRANSGSAATASGLARLHFIGHGQAEDFTVVTRIHSSTNANGQVTVDVATQAAYCN